MQPKARFGIFDWAAQWRGSRGCHKRARGLGQGQWDSDWRLRLRLGAGTGDGNYDSGATFSTVPLPSTLSIPAPLKLVAHTVERHVNINVCRHNKTDWKRIAKLPPTADDVLLPDSDFDKHLVTISELAMLRQNDFALCAKEREKEREEEGEREGERGTTHKFVAHVANSSQRGSFGE